MSHRLKVNTGGIIQLTIIEGEVHCKEGPEEDGCGYGLWANEWKAAGRGWTQLTDTVGGGVMGILTLAPRGFPVQQLCSTTLQLCYHKNKCYRLSAGRTEQRFGIQIYTERSQKNWDDACIFELPSVLPSDSILTSYFACLILCRLQIQRSCTAAHGRCIRAEK